MTTALEQRAAADSVGLRRRLVLGFGAQGLTFFAVTAQQLLLVPLFLRVWGPDLYGSWLTLLAAVDLLRMVEFGLHFHMANVMRMALAQGISQQFDRMLHVGIGLYAILLGALTMLLLLLAGLIDLPALLGTYSTSPGFNTWTLVLLALTTLLMLPRNLIIAVYSAHGEFGRGEAFNALSIISQTAATAAVLAMGAAPLHIAVVYLATTLLVSWGAVLLDQRRRYPDLRFGLALPTREEARALIEKARHYSFPVLSEIVLVRAPILILATLAPTPNAVVVFSVSRAFTGMLRQMAEQIAKASGIEMSRQYAQQDNEGRRRLYLNAGRLIGGVTGLFGGLILAVAEPFIHFWTQGRVPFDPWVIDALLAAIFLTAPAQTSVAVLQYISQSRPLARAAMLQVVISLVLCLLLVPFGGAAGAAIAMGVSETAVIGIYVAILASRDIQVLTSAFLMRAYGPALLMASFTYVGAIIMNEIMSSRTMLDLGVVCAVTLALSTGPAFFLILSHGQRRWLLMSLRARLKTVPLQDRP